MLLLVLFLVHLALMINARFTLWPEMVVYPYLINNGFILYKDIINPYPPIFPLLLSLIGRIFGYSPTPYQIITWVAIIIIDLSIFTVVFKIAKNYSFAFFALLFFIIFSIPFSINGLWFDLFQTPFVIFSVYYFFKYSKFQKVSDLQRSFYLVILAVFIKQQALWLVLFYLLILLIKYKHNSLIIIRSLLLPFTFFCSLFLIHVVYFYNLGALNDFLIWTIYQPILRGSSLPGYISLPTLKQTFIVTLPFLIVIYLAIFKKERGFLIALLALPLALFAYPRFDYFHLIPYLSVLSISIGLHLKELKAVGAKTLLLPTSSLILLLVFTIHYFKYNWREPVRFFEQDIFSASRQLKEIIPKNSVIYIQNGPDQLFPISGYLPTKPWADEFPWYLEFDNVQQEILQGIKRENPLFIVQKPYSQGDKYDLGVYRPKEIADYLDSNYHNPIQISQDLWLKSKN